MTDLGELKQKAKDLESQISTLQKELVLVKQKIVKIISIFKIGDHVYHYDRPYEIINISPRYGYETASDLRYRGRLLLKSGALGKAEHDLYGPISKIEEEK